MGKLSVEARRVNEGYQFRNAFLTSTWGCDATVSPRGGGMKGGLWWRRYRSRWRSSDILGFGWCFVVRWLVAGGRSSL